MFAPVKTLSAFVAVALVAGTASAADTRTRSLEVRYGDLNLAQKADQRTLQKRIARATIAVCIDPSTRKVDGQCRWNAAQAARVPVATAIAKAEKGDRYADAGRMTVGAGN